MFRLPYRHRYVLTLAICTSLGMPVAAQTSADDPKAAVPPTRYQSQLPTQPPAPVNTHTPPQRWLDQRKVPADAPAPSDAVRHAEHAHHHHHEDHK